MLAELRPILQIGCGGAIGFFAARWYHRDLLKQLQTAQFAVQVANREVQDVAAALSGQVGEHSQRVEAIQAKLASGGDESLAAAAELAKANARLQSDLSTATEKLGQKQDSEEAPSVQRTDPVTFLLNAQPFAESLDRFLSRKRANDQGSLVVLALEMRSASGEAQPPTEEAMREAARVLSRSLNGMDAITSRYGSHELAVLLCNASQAQARKCAIDLRLAIERLQLAGEAANQSFAVSVGLAHAEPRDKTAELVRERAKSACDAAVQAGGSCGYWHNGERCLPLEAESAATTAPAGKESPIAAAEAPELTNRPAVEMLNGVPVIEDDMPYTEKRAHERRKCQATYQIAPYWGNKLPTEDMFFTAQFDDISSGGCAILLPELPQYKAFVLALEKPDGTIFLSANIVNIRKSKSEANGRPVYAVGCKFTGRVQLPTPLQEHAARLAAMR
jgi:diguanylate cyclase (GGDEF)-like protein